VEISTNFKSFKFSWAAKSKLIPNWSAAANNWAKGGGGRKIQGKFIKYWAKLRRKFKT
jgi:hypothetical protein